MVLIRRNLFYVCNLRFSRTEGLSLTGAHRVMAVVNVLNAVTFLVGVSSTNLAHTFLTLCVFYQQVLPVCFLV